MVNKEKSFKGDRYKEEQFETYEEAEYQVSKEAFYAMPKWFRVVFGKVFDLPTTPRDGGK